MIPKECKRIAEVDFPIAAVSKHAVREKSIRHGHPSTLHLWWARRPLAACRSMLLALLLPDPDDSRCPGDFKEKARELLPEIVGKVGKTDLDLRKAILKFIAEFANWDNSSNSRFLKVGRGLVKAAHPEETPLVVDPFAGGGSIPLEALRLGCDAFASDLNPVACLILKVMLEDIPRHGPKLAEELRKVGAEIKKEAAKELAEFYPVDPDGSKPIAYLWARTVRCETPDCGAEIPLVRSFWLCKKDKRKKALRYKVKRPKNETPHIEFEIFEPGSEKDMPAGTVSRAKAACPCCNVVLPPERVKAQLSKQRGGANAIFDKSGKRTGGSRLLAVVTLARDEKGRHYRLPTDRDYEAVSKATRHLLDVVSTGRLPNGLSPVPDEPVDEWHHDVNRMPMYGMTCWGDIFTSRQMLLMLSFVRISRESKSSITLRHVLALAVDKLADKATSLCRWKSSAEYMAGNSFSRQALTLVWDFCEAGPFAGASGGWLEEIEWISKVIESCGVVQMPTGQTQQADACSHILPDGSIPLWFTDPPYYDAIDYAHCSDFFYVWLKRTLAADDVLESSFNNGNTLTPKSMEVVVDSTTTLGHGIRTPEFYEKSMSLAFMHGRLALSEDGIGSVVFAHKTTEGWEALLSGMIQGGWTITGSWPIATEMGARLRARDSAALATSIHLVCRPRPEDAPTGDWAEVLRELPNRVGDWMERLESEGIHGADLVFACIGPALEIFSRYSRVETAEGKEVTLAQYLEKVWEVVGRTALQQVLGTAEAKARNSAAGALEEDARLTALFLWTLQDTQTSNARDRTASESDTGDEDESDEAEDEEAPSKKKPAGYTLIYDVVRRFAQPLGIHLEDWEGRTIETKKGIVRLLPVKERAKQLFGEEGATAFAERFETERDPQLLLSLGMPEDRPKIKGPAKKGTRKKAKGKPDDHERISRKGPTTLDRVHAAILFQATGQTHALRALLEEEKKRGQDFMRLANALAALYPKGSEEKRLLEAMLQAAPR